MKVGKGNMTGFSESTMEALNAAFKANRVEVKSEKEILAYAFGIVTNKDAVVESIGHTLNDVVKTYNPERKKGIGLVGESSEGLHTSRNRCKVPEGHKVAFLFQSDGTNFVKILCATDVHKQQLQSLKLGNGGGGGGKKKATTGYTMENPTAYPATLKQLYKVMFATADSEVGLKDAVVVGIPVSGGKQQPISEVMMPYVKASGDPVKQEPVPGMVMFTQIFEACLPQGMEKKYQLSLKIAEVEAKQGELQIIVDNLEKPVEDTIAKRQAEIDAKAEQDREALRKQSNFKTAAKNNNAELAKLESLKKSFDELR
jgi:hypothetical protein